MGYNANRQQPVSMKVDRASNPSDKIIDYAYQYYDANGKNNNRIRQITDNVDPAYTTSYLYDDYNRLTNATSSAYTRFYSHDAWGNITDFSGVTHNFATNGSGAPATNRIISDGLGNNYSYDPAGNMTQAGSATYSYDGAGRLKEVGTGGQNVYGYDGDGMRVKKVESGSTVYYVRSSMLKNVAMEVTSTGVYRAYVYSGGKLIAQQSTDGQFYWLHTNHLGSSRAMTDVNGTLVYKGQFDPYGQALLEWSSAGNTNLSSKKFTGYERDAATGLDYANARMYNSWRGRFMQPDPAGLGASDSKTPGSLNRYSYVNNDPVNFIDLTGKFAGYFGCILMSSDGRWREGTFDECYGIPALPNTPSDIGNSFAFNLNPAAIIAAFLGAIEQIKKKKCPEKTEALATVNDYLGRSGLDQHIAAKRVANDGHGYLIEFKADSLAAVKAILDNNDYFAGGSFGGQYHEGELKDAFGVTNPTYLDYRSFNGGNTTLGDRSMQVTLIMENGVIKGAYVDTDKFNFRQDAVGAIGHAGEVAWNTLQKIFGRDCP
jgi:RHS repeat-associated protein